MVQRLPVLVSELYCFVPFPSPPLLPLRNGLYHFWFIPGFCGHRGNGDGETNSSARGSFQVSRRIRKSCRDCQTAAMISPPSCNLWAQKLKAGRFFQMSAESNLGGYKVRYQLVDLAFQLGQACCPFLARQEVRKQRRKTQRYKKGPCQPIRDHRWRVRCPLHQALQNLFLNVGFTPVQVLILTNSLWIWTKTPDAPHWITMSCVNVIKIWYGTFFALAPGQCQSDNWNSTQVRPCR